MEATPQVLDNPTDRPTRTVAVVLAVLAVGCWLLSASLAWGDVTRHTSGHLWREFAGTGIAVVLALCGALAAVAGSRRLSVILTVSASAFSLLALGFLIFRLGPQTEPRPGGLIVVAADALVIVTAALVIVPAPRRSGRVRWIAPTVAGSVTVAVLAVSALTWWPGRAIDATTTTAAPAAATPSHPTRVAWSVAVDEFGAQKPKFDGVFGGVVLLGYGTGTSTSGWGCASGVRAVSPTTGRELWHYARSGVCSDPPNVFGSDQVIAVRYGDASNPFTVLLDPHTGRELHPGALDQRMTLIYGDYGFIVERGDALPGDGGPVLTKLTVVDVRTGKQLISAAPPSCRNGVSKVTPLDSDRDPVVAVVGDSIAIPVLCLTEGQGTGSVWVVHPRAGTTSVVTLPDRVAPTNSAGVFLVASAGRVVMSYRIDNAGPAAHFLEVALDPARGQVVWSKPAPKSEVDSSSWAAAGSRVATSTGILDPLSGTTVPYPHRTDQLLPGGALASPGYLAVSSNIDGRQTVTLQSLDFGTARFSDYDVRLPAAAVPHDQPANSVLIAAAGAIVWSTNDLLVGLVA